MKTLLPLISFLLFVSFADARSVAHWPYDKLTAVADLVVIATPVAVRDTQEKTTLPGIQRSGADNIGHPIPAIGIETSFEILSVLKGDQSIKKILFYHLREVEKLEVQINGPGLVTFDPKEKKRFLLFLKRESDGRYSSLTGQTDPVRGVKDLGTYP